MGGAEALHQAIRQAADPTLVMDRIVQHALELVPSADGASLEIRLDEETLEYVSTAGTLGQFVGFRLPVGSSLSGQSVLSGRVLRCDDSETDPRVDRDACRRVGTVSMLCVPLSPLRGGIAVLKVSSQRPDAFCDEDARTLTRLAGFLQTTLGAATDVARVTADILSFLDLSAGQTDDSAAGQPVSETARFVAEVMNPGLAAFAEADERINQVLETGAFHTVVQPVVDLCDGRIIGVEALTRFDAEPERPPDHWFAEAHRVGRGDELELAAVRRALEALSALPPTVALGVNFGPSALLTADALAMLSAAPPGRIIVELTEHVAVPEYQPLLERVAELRRRGLRVAVDDTGTGYSSLAHILEVQPDIIKLDRDLTRGIAGDTVRRTLAAALVAFADEIGAVVVAEGVETEEDARGLVALGVTHGQGWFLGRPVSPGNLPIGPLWSAG